MSRAAARRLGVVATALTAVLCGCGPAAGGGDTTPAELQKPASAILSDAQSALSGSSFHVNFSGSDASGPLQFSFDVDDRGDLSGTLNFHGASGDMVIVDDRLFLRGTALLAALQASLPAGAPEGSWLRMPQAPLGPYDTVRQGQLLASCLGDVGGTYTTRGRTTLDTGAQVVEVDGRGDAEGGAPTQLYVSLGGPPYPLRWVVGHSGETAPDSCNGGNPTTSPDQVVEQGTFDFTSFGQSYSIRPPAGAVDAAAPV